MRKTSTKSRPLPPAPAFATPRQADLLQRREMAESLWNQGYTLLYISKVINVSYGSVWRWRNGSQHPAPNRARVGKSLPVVHNRMRPQDGRPPILTDTDLTSIWRQKDTWTGPEFSTAIRAQFGITYSPKYCADLLRRLRTGNRSTRYGTRPHGRAVRAGGAA